MGSYANLEEDQIMRRTQLHMLLIGAALFVIAGCANSEEWQIWRSNPTHFASGDHITL